MDATLFVCLCDLDGRYGFFGLKVGGYTEVTFRTSLFLWVLVECVCAG